MRHLLARGKGRVVVLLAGAAVLLAACGDTENGQSSLNPQGPSAQKIYNLILPIFAIAAVIGVAVTIATVVFAIKFRERPGNENPRQIHGSTPLEIGWTILPALLLAVIAVPTVATIFELADKPPRAEALQVVVTGKQWWWQFEIPRQPQFGVEKKIVTSTELHIPAGVTVVMSEASDNVIHSFWVPELAGKKDVVPGRINQLKIEADKPGTYLGACAEYCGLSHANMRFRVIAQTKDDFRAWADGQNQGPAQPYEGDIVALTGQKYACVNCHVFDNSTKTNYGPNLTHLDSRSTFAGGTFEVSRDNLTKWVKNAPSMVPMQSQGCRKPPPATCVGMPSFVEKVVVNGKQLPIMTDADADKIVSYLLGEK